MSSYKCSKCTYASEIKCNVKRHVDKICKGAELIEDIVKLQCDICNKEYATESSLIGHKKVCVAKKAVIVKEYINAIEVMDKIKSLTLLVNSLLSSNENIMNENKELKKRIEKLEGGIIIQKENLKKSYVLLEEDNEERCTVDKYKILTPKNHEEVLIKVHPKIHEKSPNYGMPLNATCLSDSGERLHCVCGDGIKITQSNGKEMRCEYGSVNLIYNIKQCKKECKYKVKKTGNCYCTDHYNEEIEEPIE